MDEAYSLFASVNPANLKSTSGRYLTAMKALSTAHRDIARRLGIAYYRLMRALFTDKTLALPGERAADTTLAALREEFMDVVAEAVPENRIRPNKRIRRAFRRAGLGDEIPELDTTEDDFVIEEEDFEWPTDLTEEAAEKTTETRLEDILDILAKRQKEREEAAKQAYEDAAVKQAGVIQKNILNAGRSVVNLVVPEDEGAIGYVRASRTGDPCYFCAMLISRGVIYKSRKTATLGADGEDYHDNCNCTAYPVFSRRQYDADPRFALNRELQKMWDSNIKNKYSGNDARNQWRRIIREWKTTRKVEEAA